MPESKGQTLEKVGIGARGGKWVELAPKPWKSIARGMALADYPLEAKLGARTRHLPRIPWFAKGLRLHPNGARVIARGPVMLPLRSANGLYAVVGSLLWLTANPPPRASRARASPRDRMGVSRQRLEAGSHQETLYRASNSYTLGSPSKLVTS